MTSPRKRTANRINATQSTGPKSAEGKRTASGNALKHGLRSPSPVLPGEDPSAWESFLASFIADLGLLGVLETELANQLASVVWRKRRVVVFEVAAAINPPHPEPGQPPRLDDSLSRRQRIEQLRIQRGRLEDTERALTHARRLDGLVTRLALAEDDEHIPPDDALFLLDAASTVEGDGEPVPVPFEAVAAGTATLDGGVVDIGDPVFLASVGVPAEFHEEPARWDGWTAAGVRTGIALLASRIDKTVNQALRELTAIDFAFLDRRVAEARAAVERLEAVELGRSAIPPDAALAVIMKYEPHLSRELARAMEALERARALRRGR